MAVSKHMEKQSTANLRLLCSKPYVSLSALEEETAKIDMDKKELESALKFLHDTGSVLHYGADTPRGSSESLLQGTVFMQPQYIIDAIRYVIREPNAKDINDELRKMDARIRQSRDECGEDLDRFLGCAEAHGSGVVTRKYGSGVVTKKLLTRHLWRDFKPADHAVLLQLMKAFKLLRPLPLADAETYVVPAMLPRSELPSEYVKPHWWCPSNVKDVAIMHLQNTTRRAEMRVMYKVRGGRLPFSFMSELQVSLSHCELETGSADANEELHFTPESAAVDRTSGSVLSAAYRCGGVT